VKTEPLDAITLEIWWSRFSREYRRLFGAPLSLDAVRMRGGAGPAAAALP
jgi:hypothetical protein